MFNSPILLFDNKTKTELSISYSHPCPEKKKTLTDNRPGPVLAANSDNFNSK